MSRGTRSLREAIEELIGKAWDASQACGERGREAPSNEDAAKAVVYEDIATALTSILDAAGGRGDEPRKRRTEYSAAGVVTKRIDRTDGTTEISYYAIGPKRSTYAEASRDLASGDVHVPPVSPSGGEQETEPDDRPSVSANDYEWIDGRRWGLERGPRGPALLYFNDQAGYPEGDEWEYADPDNHGKVLLRAMARILSERQAPLSDEEIEEGVRVCEDSQRHDDDAGPCWQCSGRGHLGSACIDDLCHGGGVPCMHEDHRVIPCDICDGEEG